MKKTLIYITVLILTHHAKAQVKDWLVHPITTKAQVQKTEDGKNLILSNGLLKKVFRLQPNLACIDYTNLSNGRQLIRAVREEARVTINGKEYAVGGLKGQQEKGYLLSEWADQFTVGTDDFRYVSYEVKPISSAIKWDSSRFWSLRKSGGTGIQVSFLYQAAVAELAGISLKVNYELYHGMPLLVKSLSITNNSGKAVTLGRIVNEVLAMVEEEGATGDVTAEITKPRGIYFETNYAFNNAMAYPYSDQTTHWKADSTYTSQVNSNRKNPCLLEIYPDKVSGITLQAGAIFNSLRTHEMLINRDDRESRGMAIRRLYPAVAPWTTTNPIFMHLISRNDQEVKTAIEQCAATGYELLILSFGSHLHIEDTTAANLDRWEQLADYAHSRGIKIGCYSLFSSRSISPDNDVIDPKTGRPNTHAMFLKAPCFGSKWGLWYSANIKRFFLKTGFDMFENDGPYPGDVCASTTHPGHKGLEDSQWMQIEMQKELYHWMSARGIYINCPDWYFLDGTNKIQMGYKEANFKLPREQQKILNRQNIYDCSWEKIPAMNWGFVPLTEYGGGGPAATLEPLSEHLDDYEQLMMQYYGAGIQACYRGPRLYDTEATKTLVIRVISWYKKYRKILNADLVHLRRADGRDWDGFLHVNASGTKEKGLMMVFNPLKQAITRTINVPLYYTGLTDVAQVKEKEGAAKRYKLNRDYSINITLNIPAGGYTWLVIE